MLSGFEYMTHLQYMNKILEREVENFRSGEKYIKIQEKHDTALRGKERFILQLQKELAELRRQIIENRKNWMEVLENMEAELEKGHRKHARDIRTLEKRFLSAPPRLCTGRETTERGTGGSAHTTETVII